jgi:glutaredoxin/pyruvate-formate lyase-activating enzyme
MNILYTAPGCSRCRIAKRFMDERGIAYEDIDIKGEGKEEFGQFYRENRNNIVRGKEGIEFPVFSDGRTVRQGVGLVIAYLHQGTGLDGFIGRNELSHGWMDGIHVSGGNPLLGDELVTVLSFIKRHGLSLHLDTDGRNASVLEKLLGRGLGDRILMEVKGPLHLYNRILGEEVDLIEVKKTMALVTRFPEFTFQTSISPIVREEGNPPRISYLTPEEVGETARLIHEVTGSHKQPYSLRLFAPEGCMDQRFNTHEKLPPNALFSYRSAARKEQVLTEIEKT